MFEIAARTDRLGPALRLDPTPFQYNSFWIMLLNGFAFWLVMHGVNQMSQQRYCSMPTKRLAIKVPFCRAALCDISRPTTRSCRHAT